MHSNHRHTRKRLASSIEVVLVPSIQLCLQISYLGQEPDQILIQLRLLKFECVELALETFVLTGLELEMPLEVLFDSLDLNIKGFLYLLCLFM